MNPYETDQFLAEYLLFHYGEPSEIMPWGFGPKEGLGFTRRTVEAGLAHYGQALGGGRALDLGCAVGGSSFVLAETFSEVLGIDFSHRFIEAARVLAAGGAIAYDRVDEGGITTPLVAGPLRGAAAGRATFAQGDAMNLPVGLAGFDFVHAANLLCRLPEPMRLVERLPGLVKTGGILVLATPCTWMETYTPRANWLGGRVEGGHASRTVERLRALLGGGFEELETRDEPFLLREHERKYQWSVSAVTVWRKRAG